MPTRTCIGCRKQADQETLVRLERAGSGRIRFTVGPRQGRGAYLCPNPECFNRAVRRDAFARAFRRAVVRPSHEDFLEGLQRRKPD